MSQACIGSRELKSIANSEPQCWRSPHLRRISVPGGTEGKPVSFEYEIATYAAPS